MLQHVLHLDRTRSGTERQKRIHTFLSHQHIGVLSTVTPDHDPHGSVVYYIVDRHFNVLFLTKQGTRKCDNMRHNSHAMLTVFDPHSQTIVQVLGRATEQSGTQKINTVANTVFHELMEQHESMLPPIMKLQAGAFTAFKLEPVQIRMAVFSQPDPGDYDSLFDSIESFELGDED